MYKLRSPIVNDYKVHPKVKYRVNLPLQMAECEINYLRLLKLLPFFNGDTHDFVIHTGNRQWQYKIAIVERSRHTTTMQLTQSVEAAPEYDWLQLPRLTVRMYHDAKLAEVLAWEGHKRLRPRYDYPNQAMYQCDEKLQINQFLGEWLQACIQHGVDASATFSF